MNDCVFCKEGSDFSYSKVFLGEDWPFSNRVVYSNSCLFAVVGYGPQVCPYILIIPYRHICSLAEMNEMEIISFYNCLQYLSCSGSFGTSMCFFEHGGSSEEGSSSIDHCHVHIIDNKNRYFDYPSFSSFRCVNDIPELTHFSPAYYLIGKYENGKLEMKAIEDTLHEHQFFRKVLAELLGEKHWNWKMDMRRCMMIDTMDLFQ